MLRDRCGNFIYRASSTPGICLACESIQSHQPFRRSLVSGALMLTSFYSSRKVFNFMAFGQFDPDALCDDAREEAHEVTVNSRAIASPLRAVKRMDSRHETTRNHGERVAVCPTLAHNRGNQGEASSTLAPSTTLRKEVENNEILTPPSIPPSNHAAGWNTFSAVEAHGRTDGSDSAAEHF